MSKITRPLSEVADAVRRCVNASAPNMPEDTREAAREGLRVLEFVANRAELFRELERLSRERPALLAIMQTFPGAQIDKIGDWNRPDGA